jgi:hypothetical protein
MSARRQFAALAVIFIVIVAISTGMYLSRPHRRVRPTEAETFCERISASLRKDSAEWQSVQVVGEEPPFWVTATSGARHSYQARKHNCDGQDFVMVVVDGLESSDWVCQYEISKDGSQIQIPDFHSADGPRKHHTEVTDRAVALGAAYWAATEFQQK